MGIDSIKCRRRLRGLPAGVSDRHLRMRFPQGTQPRTVPTGAVPKPLASLRGQEDGGPKGTAIEERRIGAISGAITDAEDACEEVQQVDGEFALTKGVGPLTWDV